MSKPKHTKSLVAFTINDIGWALLIGFALGAVIATFAILVTA